MVGVKALLSSYKTLWLFFVVKQSSRYYAWTMNSKRIGDRVKEEAAFLSHCAVNCSPSLGLTINFIMRLFSKDHILFLLTDTPSIGICCGLTQSGFSV